MKKKITFMALWIATSLAAQTNALKNRIDELEGVS